MHIEWYRIIFLRLSTFVYLVFTINACDMFISFIHSQRRLNLFLFFIHFSSIFFSLKQRQIIIVVLQIYLNLFFWVFLRTTSVKAYITAWTSNDSSVVGFFFIRKIYFCIWYSLTLYANCNSVQCTIYIHAKCIDSRILISMHFNKIKYVSISAL